MSAVEHAARGSYKPSVHGPLPPGVTPLPRRPVGLSTSPEARGPVLVPPVETPTPRTALTEADCPDVLNDEGRALWRILVAQRPTEKVLAPFVSMYVEAMLAWQRATKEVHAKGDYGKLGAKPMQNPYLRLRREAEATLFRVAQLLGWQAPVPIVNVTPVEAPKSRLELFLSARSRA
jgi:hypothetical protein